MEAGNIYETPRLNAEYLLFHYGRDEEVLPWPFGPAGALGFAVRSVRELLEAQTVPERARALDLGCAVGRSCYELAEVAEEVVGIDYSAAFVSTAERIRTEGAVTYLRVDEGTATTPCLAERPPKARPERIRFEQGDVMDLRGDLGGFDVVHAANLLCRLRNPEKLLERLPALVKPGGQLLLTTPCTWLEEFTAPAEWPAEDTLSWLRNRLEGTGHFVLEMRKDLPFLIREHARKFQWSVALGTRWRRCG